MNSDDSYIGTRRQLRGVAESLVAGPQYRSAGTIRLAVRAGGFGAVAIPVAVQGTDLVLPDGTVPLAGSVSSIADIAGIDAGPPQGAYDIVDPLPPDAELSLDAETVSPRMMTTTRFPTPTSARGRCPPARSGTRRSVRSLRSTGHRSSTSAAAPQISSNAAATS